MATYPTIHGIRFAEDDVRFLDDQAEKQGALQGFIILLALERVADIATRVGKIRRLVDVLDPIVNTAIDVASPNWEDAAEGLLNIQFSMAMMDIQLHLQGKYMSYKKRFKAPVGKSKQFFKALLTYFTDLRSKLSPGQKL